MLDTPTTSDTFQQKKREYQKAKEAVLAYLRELMTMLESVGDEPLSGEQRKTFMDKFAALDHRLLDHFDVRSYEYFEEQDRLKKGE